MDVPLLPVWPEPDDLRLGAEQTASNWKDYAAILDDWRPKQEAFSCPELTRCSLDFAKTVFSSPPSLISDTAPLNQRLSSHSPSHELLGPAHCRIAHDSIASEPQNEPQWKLIKLLGQGGQGKTYLWKFLPSDTSVAAKYPRKGKEKEVLREITIIRHLAGHPNIVHLWNEIFNAPPASIAMEYADLGDLHYFRWKTYISQEQQVPELAIRHFFMQMASALDWMHNKCGTVHTDIKPANILIYDYRSIGATLPHFRLTDFGSARQTHWDKPQLPKDNARYIRGTPEWQPPEREIFDPPADIFALGSIVHWLVHGRPPILYEKNPPKNAVLTEKDRFHSKRTWAGCCITDVEDVKNSLEKELGRGMSFKKFREKYTVYSHKLNLAMMWCLHPLSLARAAANELRVFVEIELSTQI